MRPSRRPSWAFRGSPPPRTATPGGREFAREEYAHARAFLAEFVPAAVDTEEPGFDYANVNVPVPGDLATTEPVRATELTYDCDVRIEPTEGEEAYSMYDPFYDPLRPETDAAVRDPPGTDRRAIAEGAISVTPLRIRGRTGDLDRLDWLTGGSSGDRAADS